MLPLVLLPALGILPAERVANNYFKDMCVLFFGGLIVAAALEAVGLHRRIALKVLLVFGTKPAQLLLGFMSATAFLSMWMSNTATTAMMMPIVEAVLQQLEAAAAGGAAAGEAVQPPAALEDVGKALVLAVAYAANVRLAPLCTLTSRLIADRPTLLILTRVSPIYSWCRLVAWRRSLARDPTSCWLATSQRSTPRRPG